MSELGAPATFGIYVMHLLARRSRAASLAHLSKSAGMPPKDARRMLARLRAAGLVASRPRRGYVLGRAPGQISMLDIVRAAQLPEKPRTPCGGDFEACPSRASCVLSPLCRASRQGFEEALRSFTLADLAEAPLGLPNCRDPALRTEAS